MENGERHRNFKDLTGLKFNKLTVIKLDSINKRKESLWFCKCDCGNEKVISRSNLKAGEVKSCGCLRHGDLIGQKFGNLLVLEKAFIKKQTVYWKCQCACGKQCNIRGKSLTYGQALTCGYCKAGRHITGFEMSSFRNGAKARNIPFNITTDDIDKLYEEQNKKCALSGLDIVFNSNYIKGNGKIINGTASLDRIDSSKPYTRSNIQLVHKRINIMKGNMSDEEFKYWIFILNQNLKPNGKFLGPFKECYQKAVTGP